jgi:hypothetical protein
MRFLEELTTEHTESTEFFQKRVLKVRHSRKVFALGIAGLFLISVAQAVESQQAVDPLDEAQVQKALEAVRANFLSSEQLDKASQRALLQGLIERLGPGVSIVETDAKPENAEGFPFLAEILDGRAGYIRPGTLDAAAFPKIDEALKNFGEKSIGAVILDLRGIPAEPGFDGAAEVAKRFCSKGAVLFTVQKPNAKQERIVTNDEAPVFDGVLVLLVDQDTCGAAEILAATLRDNAKAMLVGSQTAGAAVEFEEFPVGAGRSVRVAVAQALVPKSGALFPKGVAPDIAVRLDSETRDKIFDQASKEGAGLFAFDVEPPRMNEAALVANTNPEITEDSREKASLPLRDTVLQRAVDLVTAIGFYKK